MIPSNRVFPEGKKPYGMTDSQQSSYYSYGGITIGEVR